MNKPERLKRGTAAHEYLGFAIAINPEVQAGRLGRYLAAGRQFARLEHAREYIDSELTLAG